MHKSVLHEWFDEIWNQGNEAAVHRLLAENGVLHDLAQDGKDSSGPSGFLEFFRKFHAAFPDMHIKVHETVSEGELQACRWEARGTHTGDTLGFPATRSAVTFSGMSMARIAQGKIVEGWNVWDAAGLNKQLGI